MHLPPLPYDLRNVIEQVPSDASGLGTFVDRREPFLVRGSASRWALLEAFEQVKCGAPRIRRLEELLGDSIIRWIQTPVEQHGFMGIGSDLKPTFSINRSTDARAFADTVAELVARPTGECAYAAAANLGGLPRLDNLVPPASIFGIGEARSRRIWMGSGDHVVDLHYDQMQNIATVIEGTKRFTLFPPEALPFIYPAPMHRTVSNVVRSLVPLLHWDEATYPRFASALEMARVAVVRPGDVLAIPPLWWHHVESFGFNVMVNMWFTDLDPKRVSAVERTMNTTLAAVAKLDDSTVNRLGDLYQNKEISRAKVETVLQDDTHKIRRGAGNQIYRCLIAARDSLASLPDGWRRAIEGRYRYYVFRYHGDPYPTLPGALDDVVRFQRHNGLGYNSAIVSRASGLMHRIADRLSAPFSKPRR